MLHFKESIGSVPSVGGEKDVSIGIYGDNFLLLEEVSLHNFWIFSDTGDNDLTGFSWMEAVLFRPSPLQELDFGEGLHCKVAGWGEKNFWWGEDFRCFWAWEIWVEAPTCGLFRTFVRVLLEQILNLGGHLWETFFHILYKSLRSLDFCFSPEGPATS